MNPLDPIVQRLQELERQTGALEDTFKILRDSPDFFEAVQVASLKRGSRRLHGGLPGFL